MATRTRLEPVAGMSAPERRIWREIVSAFPAGWFRPSDRYLLAELTRAVAMANALAGRIAKADPENLKSLLQLRDTESRRAAALATKLRLPPQSRSDRHAAGTAAERFARGRPWDAEDTDQFFDGGKQ